MAMARDRSSSLALGAPAVEREHGRVHHEREQGGEHRDEPRERELRPGPPGQARRAEVVEGVRQDVHVAGAEDDPRREGLDDDEGVAARTERRHGAGEERQAHADDAGEEDRHDGDQLQAQRVGDAVAFAPDGRTTASAVAIGRRCLRLLRLRDGGGDER